VDPLRVHSKDITSRFKCSLIWEKISAELLLSTQSQTKTISDKFSLKFSINTIVIRAETRAGHQIIKATHNQLRLKCNRTGDPVRNTARGDNFSAAGTYIKAVKNNKIQNKSNLKGHRQTIKSRATLIRRIPTLVT